MAFTASGGLITQTFQTRDLNFSGLVGLPGVTRTVDSGTTYYDLSTNRLSIQGTIFHDPEKEVLIFHHNATGIGTPAQVIYVYSAVAGWSSGHTYTRDEENYVVVNKESHGFLSGDAVQNRSSIN